MKEVRGCEHLVIGTSSNSGVRNPQQLREFLMDAFSHTLASTLKHAMSEDQGQQRERKRSSMSKRWSIFSK